ncbi:hypothetical protein CFC21_057265 [Triticum aestivum]|uniref:Glycosyltransferase n=3 Tax=Triticum TaxID=4564 RepID=A0A9R0SZ69_TRITD|nr:cyanidin 3-O-rutinoside 5-O-glucosyltransferase-like [Triticum dicoccoides]XP_044372573.1 cyanidin 3-O-rutinoside 5-O-glucosyltransferase-like [Triticum aestivum]KAF7048511.1 hypothetical protein CFC21_057265 [Triticum aestivum]VAI04222.1 unnamed protein product [Triticum turgidum subsp. durum]
MAQPAVRGEHGDVDGRRTHFLVAAYGIQGHLNPARALARRLAAIDGVTATLSVPLFGHRRMFPSASPDDQEVSDGVISYAPFSDGQDDGSWPTGTGDEMARRRRASCDSLSTVVRRLASAGRPVTCVVCTLNMPTVVQVARAHGLPLAVYWIQPATALVAYYHYFHGHGEGGIAVHAADPAYEATLPGLRRPMRMGRDMPSFLADDATGTGDELSQMIVRGFREMFEQMDDEEVIMKPCMVLANTFEALEETALEAIRPYLGDVFAIGAPVVPLAGAGEDQSIHLFAQDEEKRYMAWLDSQPPKSVVYVSWGSLLTYSERQAEEILRGIRRLGRPYLWVVRREGRSPEVDRLLLETAAAVPEGMVVEWCDQVRVLSHPSVACFVTHCGWNSTLEAVACGMPAVAAPSWSDQPVNAHLLAEEWGVAVRAEREADGVLTGAELARCVELAVGSGDMAAAIAANSRAWKERAREAVAAGGPSERSLRSFVKRVQEVEFLRSN